MPINTLTLSKPVSDYRCSHCDAAAWLTMPTLDRYKSGRDNPMHIIHVRHKDNCPLGMKKEFQWGMPREI